MMLGNATGNEDSLLAPRRHPGGRAEPGKGTYYANCPEYGPESAQGDSGLRVSTSTASGPGQADLPSRCWRP